MNRLTVRRITAVLRGGRRVSIPCWILDSGRPGPRLLAVAAQHGNELQGVEALRRFVETCCRSAIAGKIFAVPFANLPAVRHGRPHIGLGPEQRYEDDRGHNMNRTWPGRRNGNDTERVSWAIYRAFGDAATHALDLHTWERDHAPALLLVDTPELRELAPRLGARFAHFSANPRPGMLAAHFCATGRSGILFETCGQYEVREDQVGQALLVALNYAKVIGLLRGRPRPLKGSLICSGQHASAVVRAACSGLFVRGRYRLGDRVRAGALLGHILSDRDLSRVSVRSAAGGWLQHFGPGRPGCDVSLQQLHDYVRRGEALAVIARPRAKH